MCGIFAYFGESPDAAARTYRGLCELEYRGYDSWGIAAKTPDTLFVNKTVGKISDASEKKFVDVNAKIAIGHSRWATHGGVSAANTHPHFDANKRIAVVHNGIIENYRELREELERAMKKKGKKYLFVSETDTEVIPHLISSFMAEGKSFQQSFVSAARKLSGRFAFVAIDREDSIVLAARDGSPLVLGKNGTDYYLASDVPAFLDHTNVVNYVNDRQYVVISENGVRYYDLDSDKPVTISDETIHWERSSATKEGWDHFMIKEIMEQRNSIASAIRQNDHDVERVAQLLEKFPKILITGCGTAAKVAMIGQYLFSEIARRRVVAVIASELGVVEPFIDKDTLVLAISQSGETADVLHELNKAKEKGATIVSILNVVGSSIDRMSDAALYINVGPEIAVASTKAATGQIAVLLLLAYAASGHLADGKRILRRTSKVIKDWLQDEYVNTIKKVAKKIHKENDIYIIGRGRNFPIALEAAIKIQEVSYIHAEGFAGGELKHGPIALIRKGTPCIAIVPNDETKKDMESTIQELKARGARIIGIAPERNPLFDSWFHIPEIGNASPIATLVPVQILSYYLALLRGNDPDKPRNLAKSVTVK